MPSFASLRILVLNEEVKNKAECTAVCFCKYKQEEIYRGQLMSVGLS